MALEVTLHIDEPRIAEHLTINADEAMEVLALIANSFDTEADARQWAAQVADAHTLSVAHGTVMPLLLVLVEAIAKAEAA